MPSPTNISRTASPQELPFILPVRVAADWLGIHHDTLRGYASGGIVRHVRIGGKLCFRRDELLADISKASQLTRKHRTRKAIA